MFTRRPTRARLFITLVLLWSAASRPQDNSPQPERPRFRAEVAAVLVDVLVTDSEGLPVRGLTRDDFEVFEDGFPQTIQNFEIVDFTASRSTAAVGSDRDERPMSFAASPRRFVLVLNRQGAEFRLMMRAKEALESFVLDSMVAGDEAMVIDMSQTTDIVEPFTSSKEDILRAVRDIPALRANTFYGTRLATENVYRDLSSLADGLGAYPGRKILVFMSPTLTKTRDLTPVLRNTIASLNSANTTVYSVNIVGVDSIARAAEESMEAVSEVRAPTVVAETGAPAPDIDTIEVGGLFPLAHETGGRYFMNTNVFEPAVRSIGRENELYYLVTYTPTSRALDDRYHRIHVRVRPPNVRVRARRGYFARHPATETTDASRESPFEITSYLFPSAGGDVEVVIAVAIPTVLLAGETTGPASRAFELTLFDSAGTVRARFSDIIDPRDPTVLQTAVLTPGSYQARVALNDGVATVYRTSAPVDVPSGFGERFGLSSIVAFTHAEPAKSSNKLPVRPRSTIGRGQNAFLYFHVMPGRRGERSRTARLVCSIFQGEDEVLGFEQPNVLDLTEGDEGGLVVMTELPTGKLAEGVYRIVVRASDPELGRSASGELSLTVTP